MHCSECIEWMNRHLDGDSRIVDDAAWQAHVSQCDTCLAQWQALQSIEALLASAPLAGPTPGFGQRVIARIETRAVFHSRMWSLFRLCATSLGVWALAWLAVLSIGSVAWPTMVRITLLQAIVQVVRGTAQWGWALAGALRTVLVALCAGPFGYLIVVYTALACIIVVSWWQIVLRRRMPSWLYI